MVGGGLMVALSSSSGWWRIAIPIDSVPRRQSTCILGRTTNEKYLVGRALTDKKDTGATPYEASSLAGMLTLMATGHFRRPCLVFTPIPLDV
jgi:hypothetical protein